MYFYWKSLLRFAISVQDPSGVSVVCQRTAWQRCRVHRVYSEVKTSDALSHCQFAQMSQFWTLPPPPPGSLGKANRSLMSSRYWVSLTYTIVFKTPVCLLRSQNSPKCMHLYYKELHLVPLYVPAAILARPNPLQILYVVPQGRWYGKCA